MLFRVLVEQLLLHTVAKETRCDALLILKFIIRKTSVENLEALITLICSKLMTNVTENEHLIMVSQVVSAQIDRLSPSSSMIPLAITSLNFDSSSFKTFFFDHKVDAYDLRLISDYLSSSVHVGASLFPLIRLEKILDNSPQTIQKDTAADLCHNIRMHNNTSNGKTEIKQTLARLQSKIQLLETGAYDDLSNTHQATSEVMYIGYEVALDYLQEAVFSLNYECAERAIDACGKLISLSDDVSNHLMNLRFLKKSYNLPPRSPKLDLMNDESFWHAAGKTEDEWVSSFTLFLLKTFDDSFFQTLDRVLMEDSVFAKTMIPYLIHLPLLEERLSQGKLIETQLATRRLISKQFQSFFNSAQPGDEFIVKIMSDVIYFLATYERNSSLEWLDLNYLQISKCASISKMHLDGLFNLERWFIYLDNQLQDINFSIGDSLLTFYKGLGDQDGFLGAISALDVTDFPIESLIIQKNEHDCHWENICRIQDSALQVGTVTDPSILHKYLGKSGYYHILREMVAGSKDVHYESLWRLGNWDLPLTVSQKSQTIHESLYSSLKYFDQHRDGLESAHIATAGLICFEGKSNLIFIEMQEARNLSSDLISSSEIFCTWDRRTALLTNKFAFQDMEMILSYRTRMLISLTRGENSLAPGHLLDSVNDYLARHLLEVSALAIEADDEIISRTSLARYSKLISLNGTSERNWRAKLLSYKLEWMCGDKSIALKYINQLTSCSTEVPIITQAEVAHLGGEWSRETRAL